MQNPTTASNGADYVSKEGANPPILEVEVDNGSTATPEPTATSTSTKTATPTATPTPQVTSITYNYDGGGRDLCTPEPRSGEWGNLVKSVLGDAVTYYVGAHYEKRVQGSQQNERKYYFAGANRIAMRENSTLIWLLTDHLGSTSVTANASGNLLSSLRYTAFGETRSASGTTNTDYRYTGQREDSYINLTWMGSRWYDQTLGRFISPDSLVPDKGNPQGLDRYAYVANGPVSRIDTSGHCWGFASGIREIPGYGTTCNNLDMALTIVQSDETSLGEKVVAGGYIAAEGLAHGALVAGAGMLACSAVAPCTAAGEAILGIGTKACADGDCTNEVQAAANISKNVASVTHEATKVAGNRYWTQVINFKESTVYQRPDLINPSLTQGGLTNLQRMQQGLAPIGPDGARIQLHHLLQTMDGPIAEVTQTFHRAYSSIIHINQNTIGSGIDRAAFNAWRAAYWINRAKDFIDQ